MKKALFISAIVLFTGLAAAQNFENEPVMGPDDANVTMVMYEDLQCPFCKRFETNTFSEIESTYVETGEVKIVWKDFPLPELHNWAEDGAKTMECVYREGGDNTFWEVKEKVYENQDDISESNVQSKIKSWAEEEGLDSESVDSCLENGDPLQEVKEDKKQGEEKGISGTPGFLINGEKITGAQPYSKFQEAINNARKGNSQKEDGEREITNPSRPPREENTSQEEGDQGQGEEFDNISPPELPDEKDNSDLRQRVKNLESQIEELRKTVNRLENTVEELEENSESQKADRETESGEGEERSGSGEKNERSSQEEKKDTSSNSGSGGVLGFVGGLVS